MSPGNDITSASDCRFKPWVGCCGFFLLLALSETTFLLLRGQQKVAIAQLLYYDSYALLLYAAVFAPLTMAFALAGRLSSRLRVKPWRFALVALAFLLLGKLVFLTKTGTLHGGRPVTLTLVVALLLLLLWKRERLPIGKHSRLWPLALFAWLVLAAGLQVSLAASAGDRERTSKRLPASGAPNVLLIVVDCLRWDACGTYDQGDESLTPNIDRIAEDGVVFERAFALSSWTVPSVTSLLSSLYPLEQSGALSQANLGAALSEAGYQTCAVSANPVLSDRYFTPGFSLVDNWTSDVRRSLMLHQLLAVTLTKVLGAKGCNYVLDLGSQPWVKLRYAVYLPGGDVVHRFSKWIATALCSDRPWFAYVHFMDPHDPYRGRPYSARNDWPSLANLAVARELYNGEVAYVDDCIGSLIAALSQQDMFRNTVVVVTADHGEEFLEHGESFHAKNLFNTTLRVPLIISGPSVRRKGRIQRPVSHLDLAPTVAGLVDCASPPAWRGKDLSALLERKDATPQFSPVYASLEESFIAKSGTLSECLIDTEGNKLILVSNAQWAVDVRGRPYFGKLLPATLSDCQTLLFAADDSLERRNRAISDPLTVGQMRQTIRHIRDAALAEQPTLPPVPDWVTEKWRTLGYVN